MGVVIPFPARLENRFTAEMRRELSRYAAGIPGLLPLMFGTDGDGAEVCLLGNGLTIGWSRGGRLVLTDTQSGFVDQGTFATLDEVCCLITYLTI